MLLICSGISYMQSITAFGHMQNFLAVLTSSPVLLEVVSATVTPALVEEIITLQMQMHILM